MLRGLTTAVFALIISGAAAQADPAAPAAAVKREFKHEMDGRHHVTKVFENGKLVRKDYYGDYGGVYVTHYDAAGNPIRLQQWFQTQKRDAKGGWHYQYSLMRVTEYHPGTDVKQRSFTMNYKQVWDLSEFDSKGRITTHRRFYHNDGTLSEEDLYDLNGNITKTIKHKASEKIRGSVTPAAIARPDGLRRR